MMKFLKKKCAIGLVIVMLVGIFKITPGVHVYADEETDQDFTELENCNCSEPPMRI